MSAGNVIEGRFNRDGKPWRADTWPTPEQFADWYVEQPREERVRLARWIVLNGQEAERCHLMNHEGRIEQADAALRSLYAQVANDQEEGA